MCGIGLDNSGRHGCRYRKGVQHHPPCFHRRGSSGRSYSPRALETRQDSAATRVRNSVKSKKIGKKSTGRSNWTLESQLGPAGVQRHILQPLEPLGAVDQRPCLISGPVGGPFDVTGRADPTKPILWFRDAPVAQLFAASMADRQPRANGNDHSSQVLPALTWLWASS